VNLRKHAAGFALFSVIVGSAIFINAYLRLLTIKPDPVLIRETVPQAPLRASQTISFKVRQVSVDLVNKETYTELRLERQPGQDVPEHLWVTTVFFTPAHPGIVGISKVEITLSQSNQSDFVATASNITFARNMDGGECFARVYVSTRYSDYSNFQDETFIRDLTDAVPVVIHWPSGRVETKVTVKKFTY
jgi:hypothetical protein